MSELKQGPITWEEAAKISPDYAAVLETEELGHELHISEHGTLRWVADPEKEQEMMDMFGARDLNDLYLKGADKNDPRIRELYKHMGCSLYYFWEVFYWEVNNELAYQYMGRLGGNKKRLKFSVVVEIDKDGDAEEFMDSFVDYLNEAEHAETDDAGYALKIVSIIEEE